MAEYWFNIETVLFIWTILQCAISLDFRPLKIAFRGLPALPSYIPANFEEIMVTSVGMVL
jgi:hypothetical protein